MRHALTIILAVVSTSFIACKTAPEKAPEPVEPSETDPGDKPEVPSVEKPQLCIQPVPFMAQVVAHASDDAVQFCVERGTDDMGEAIPSDCWRVDFGSGALAPAGPLPPFKSISDMGASSDRETGVVKVCPLGPMAVGCTEVKPKLGKGEAVGPIALDAANAKIAYAIESDDAEQLSKVAVDQLSPYKRLATFTVGDGSFRCPVPQFVGDLLYLNISVCAGPGAIGELRDLKGKKLGGVGPVSADGIPFPTYGHDALQHDGDVWAFLETTGQAIALQNVRTGKVDKTIPLAPGDEQVPFANPGESGWDKTPDGRFVVVGAGPVVGTTWVIDPKAGTYRKLAVPVCAEP